MNNYIIQIEPETLDDYKEIVRQRYGNLNSINVSEIRLLESYKTDVGNLKDMPYDEILEEMWSKI